MFERSETFRKGMVIRKKGSDFLLLIIAIFISTLHNRRFIVGHEYLARTNVMQKNINLSSPMVFRHSYE